MRQGRGHIIPTCSVLASTSGCLTLEHLSLPCKSDSTLGTITLSGLRVQTGWNRVNDCEALRIARGLCPQLGAFRVPQVTIGKMDSDYV
jgi:hypothetical protein